MSYSVNMKAKNIRCQIPLSQMQWLQENFEEIRIKKPDIDLLFEWEEDGGEIKGKLIADIIVLCKEQEGRYLNSSDGGLGLLLGRFKGNGEIIMTGEEGDTDFIKYTNGKAKKGKIIYK